MQIVYAKSVYEQITSAQLKAEREGKEIEKIILTEREYTRLKRELGASYALRRRVVEGTVAMVNGIPIELEERSKVEF